MSDPRLLLEAARFCAKLDFLWAAYPPKAQYGHLRQQASDLAKRLRAAAPSQTETKDTDGVV